MRFWRGFAMVGFAVAAHVAVSPTCRASDEYAEVVHTLEGPVALAWEARYDGPISGYDEGMQIAVSPDGSMVFVTGQSDACTTIAYDARTGAELWIARFGADYDRPRAICVNPMGTRVYIAIERYRDSGDDYYYYTVAYDALTGQELWSVLRDPRRYASIRDMDLAVSKDGTKVFMGGQKGFVVAYDAETGGEVWTYWLLEYPHGGSVMTLAVSEDGTLVIASGWVPHAHYAADLVTVAIDAQTGERVWENIVVSTYREYIHPRDIVHSEYTGNVIVGGFWGTGYWGTYPGLSYSYWARAYDAETGAEVWYEWRTHNHPYRFTEVAIALDPAGEFVVLAPRGDLHGTLGNPFHVLDTETGTERWEGFPPGSIRAVGVSRDGEQVLHASEFKPVVYSKEYRTAAMDASDGSDLWSARYAGRSWFSADYPRALAINPVIDIVYVTGKSRTKPDTDYDYATIAYWLVLPIDLDIKPGSDTNPVNVKSHGLIPAVILGSDTVDLNEIDLATLRFGPWGAQHVHDLGHPDVLADHMQDVNDDGHVDLVVHYFTLETGIQCGDTEATLSGNLFNERPLEGKDGIETKGCN